MNCDGQVTLPDAVIDLELAAGILGAAPCASDTDVDCSGETDGLDVLNLLRYLVQLASMVSGDCAEIGST